MVFTAISRSSGEILRCGGGQSDSRATRPIDPEPDKRGLAPVTSSVFGRKGTRLEPGQAGTPYIYCTSVPLELHQARTPRISESPTSPRVRRALSFLYS